MKAVRLFLIILGVLVALAVVAVGVASTSWFQTWAARLALASNPALRGSIGTVSAGYRRIHLEDLHLERSGAVLTVPSLDADVPLLPAGVSRDIGVNRLYAHGWTLDLSGLPSSGAMATMPAVGAPAAVIAAFSGLFRQLELPADVALDGIDLQGKIILPPLPGYASGKADVTVKGGGLAAGKTGSFDFEVAITLDGPQMPVTSLKVKGTVTAGMATPRSFKGLGVHVTATAFGPQFIKGVTLVLAADATHAMGGESYTMTISGDTKQLAAIQADFPDNTKHLAGTWSLDVNDRDLAPFVFGRGLPAFDAMGQGSFDTDAAFTSLRAQGRLNADADRLQVLKPELAAVGRLTLQSEFDLAVSHSGIRVDRLKASLAGKTPVASVEALQPFEYKTTTGELKVANPNADLVGLTVQGLPLAWLVPFAPSLLLQGDDVKGEFTLDAGSGGLAVRSKAPLSLTNLVVGSGGKPVCTGIDVSAYFSGLYTPQGWQVQLAPLSVKSVGATMLTLSAKAGQLVGKTEPISTTGHWELSLPALLAQPACGARVALTGGVAKGDFTMTLGGKREIDTTIAITQLAVDPAVSTVKLPEIAAGLRADFDGSGAVTFRSPLTITQGTQQSDLTLSGTVSPGATSPRFDLQVTGDKVYVDDCRLFGALVAPGQPVAVVPATPATPAPTVALTADKQSFWSVADGRIVLSLKSVLLNGQAVATGVDGALRLAPGSLTIERLKASFVEGSTAKVSGVVSFDASAPKPYALTGEMTVANFNTGAFLKSLDSSRAPMVDGKFNITGNFGGRGLNFADLGNRVEGDLQLTSKSGSFNALSVGIESKMADTGRIANAVASLGDFASALTGRKDVGDVASRAQAIAEFCKILSPIKYDQLSVSLTRGSDLSLVLKNFSLISPDIRLLGTGQVTYIEAQPITAWPLALSFSLRARGRTVDLLKKANAVEAKPDDLGYSACTVPFNVAGTVGQPDTSELQASLTKLAFEKSDLLNRLFGK